MASPPAKALYKEQARDFLPAAGREPSGKIHLLLAIICKVYLYF
jgi:hypothetical protein